MNKLNKSNIYFLIVMLLSIILPKYLVEILVAAGIRDIRILQFLNHIILFLIPAIIYVFVTKANVRETFRFNKLYFKDILLLIVISFVCYPLMGFISAISQMFFENNVGTFMAAISDTPYWGMLILMAVTPAITEEVTLRGIVLSGYDNQSKFKAAVMTGLLFGIFHLDFQQFLYAAALGFIFAYIVRITNSIFASMLMHFIINGISVTLQKVIYGSGNEMMEAVQETGLMEFTFDEKVQSICIYIILIICFGGLVHKLIKKLEKWNIERGTLVEENNEEEFKAVGGRIINTPFIVIVGIYITYMVYDVFLR